MIRALYPLARFHNRFLGGHIPTTKSAAASCDYLRPHTCCLLSAATQKGRNFSFQTTEEIPDDDPVTIVKRKKKLEENFYGIAHVQATFNNTIVNITDVSGDTLAWSSGGAAEGYRGSRKKSPFAGQLAAEKAAEKAQEKGVRSIRVKVKGIGRGRETALRALINSGIEVTGIEDVTPLPHNGCRPKKSKRR